MNNFHDKLKTIGYNKSVVCNSVPSWFDSIYGNMLLVKDVCNDTICEQLQENIFTFDKSKTTTMVSGSHEGTKETRCYIKIKFNYNGNEMFLYVTHLDVASEKDRVKQINQIMDDIDKHQEISFIVGDFNTFDKNDTIDFDWKSNDYTKDNGEVIQSLKDRNYFDCHESKTTKMTTWNNTRVDFIFCNRKITGNIRAEYYYTLSSDHIPVVLTLTPDIKFHKEEKKPKQLTEGGKRRTRRRTNKKRTNKRKKTKMKRRKTSKRKTN
jgi:hypothetical protein